MPNSASRHAREDVGGARRRRGRGSPRARGACVGASVVADHLQREIGLHAWRSCRSRRRGTAASRHARPGCGADSRAILRFKLGVDRLAEIMPSSMYSAGMVASASSSNTQWPSGAAASEQRIASPPRCAGRDRLSVGGWSARSSSATLHRSWSSECPSAIGDQVGGAIAGSDRTFDGRGQAGICPIASEDEIAPRSGGARAFASCVGRRGEGRAPLAHDLPRRHRIGRQAATAATSLQIVLAKFLARRVDQPVAGADGDRQPAGKGEQPFDRAVEHAEDRRLSGGGSMRKCALTMARNSVGTVRSRISALAT